MKIQVKHIERGTYSNRREGLNLTCDHEYVEVTPPCCSGSTVSDCDCRGQFSIYCPDCPSVKIPDSQIDEILEKHEAGVLSYAR